MPTANSSHSGEIERAIAAILVDCPTDKAWPVGNLCHHLRPHPKRAVLAMLEHMNLRPILDLDLRLGEGTGAALSMTLLDAGLKIYREMATFGEARVSKKNK